MVLLSEEYTMATDDVHNILDQIKHLPLAEQQQVAQKLAEVIARSSQPRRSILELRGLGKEIWKDIDPQEYVRQERDAWSQ